MSGQIQRVSGHVKQLMDATMVRDVRVIMNAPVDIATNTFVNLFYHGHPRVSVVSMHFKATPSGTDV